MTGLLRSLDRLIATVVRWLVIVCLAGILALVASGVVARSFPWFSMSGYDEVVELLVVWMTFLGGVALWREGALFRVDLVGLIGWRPLAAGLDLLARLAMLAFAVVFTVEGWRFAAGAIETMPFLLISKQAWYAAMPVSGVLMTAYAVAGVLGRGGTAWRPAAPATLDPVSVPREAAHRHPQLVAQRD